VGLARTVRYRVGQFLRALTARYAISEDRISRAAALLSPQARALFKEQTPQDQRHALEVYETLVDGGHTNRDLLTAALLHDVGKAACRTSPWKRGLLVLAGRLAPGALDHFARDGTESGKNALSFREMAKLDIQYARQLSFWLDIRIVARTPLVVLGEMFAWLKRAPTRLAGDGGRPERPTDAS